MQRPFLLPSKGIPFGGKLNVFVTTTCEDRPEAEALGITGVTSISLVVGYEVVFDKAVVESCRVEPCQISGCSHAQRYRLVVRTWTSTKFILGLSLGKLGGSLFTLNDRPAWEDSIVITDCECCPAPTPVPGAAQQLRKKRRRRVQALNAIAALMIATSLALVPKQTAEVFGWGVLASALIAAYVYFKGDIGPTMRTRGSGQLIGPEPQ